jgi:hypothetical protein
MVDMRMKLLSTIAVVAAAAAISTSASAFDFVTNGGFESSTYASNTQFGGVSGAPYVASQGVTGWTGLGGAALEFYYIGGTQTTVNAVNRFNDPQAFFRNDVTLSPNGGNFVGLDGDPGVQGGISQTINGLVIGEFYNLDFNWGSAQLRNRIGDTTEQLQITFGGSTVFTPVLPTPSETFTGWKNGHFVFQATSNSQTLSFLSIGTPGGLPPIALLDGVSITAVPEPTAWAMMLLGFGGIGTMIRRRRQTLVAA